MLGSNKTGLLSIVNPEKNVYDDFSGYETKIKNKL